MQKIEEKLGLAFKKSSNIDESLKVGSSTVLSQKIEFQAASRPQSAVSDVLKDKYINLTASQKITHNGNGTEVPAKKTSSSSSIDEGEGLPQPREILYPANRLNYNWKFSDGGAGLMNCGNTCFLNACLQCLVHTPPLTNYLISGHHFSECKVFSREKCILCNLQMLMRRSLVGGTDSFSPKWFINNLHFIGRHFRNGRQEDAHEFLRLSLEKMQKCALAGRSGLDKYSKETTVINQIFGGFLRSQVMCLRCKHRSNTYDPLLDISLDIKNVDSLQRAFELFVAPDKLDMDNAYKCEKCKQKVTALKRFSIHKPPNVLTVQLKRFQFASSSFFGGGKISKFIKYPSRLNIRGFMSNKNGPPEMYTLFATIQHEGYSCQSGHYVANVRCGEKWYHFNDSIKRRTSLQQCLNESSAYVLFYMRDNTQPSIVQNPSLSANSQLKAKQEASTNGSQNSKFIGPVHPSVKNPFRVINGDKDKPTTVSPFKPASSPLAAKREKIQINLAPKPVKYSPGVQTSSKLEQVVPSTPPDKRIVMKIKGGKSFTYETSPDGHRKMLSDDEEVVSKLKEKVAKKYTKKSQLVPYGDDSSSDSDRGDTDGTLKKRKNSPPKVAEKTQVETKAENVVFDEKLNATTSVPGNAHLYETVTLKDKLNHTGQNLEKKKDTNSSPPKFVTTIPIKRHYSDSLTCITSPTAPKHMGSTEWSTQSADVLQSPSIGSSHSSNHSTYSTSDWSVTPNKLINGNTKSPKVVEKEVNKSDTGSFSVQRKDSMGSSKSHTNLKRQAMQEQLRSEEIKRNGFPSPFEVVDEKKSLISPDLTEDDQHEKRKKHKKHKKRKYRDEEKQEALKTESPYEESKISPQKKKKKKKKHKHRERDRDSDEEDSRAGKRRLDYQEEEEAVKKKRSREDSSSPEFEWVEKTSTPHHTKSASSIQAQMWDHHYKDSVKKSSSHTDNPLKAAKSELDGYKIVRELQHSASYGYGAPVKSWEGSRSHLDVLNGHGYNGAKRHSSDDEYEEELDRGRVKKVKTKHNNDQRYSGNLFQREQDRKHNKKINWSGLKIGNNNPYMRQDSAPTLPTNTHYRF